MTCTYVHFDIVFDQIISYSVHFILVYISLPVINCIKVIFSETFWGQYIVGFGEILHVKYDKLYKKYNLDNNLLHAVDVSPVTTSRGDMGAFSPQSEALPTTCPPPPSKEKNGQNQPFSAIFLIFAPSESHFAFSIPPKKFWCRHCVSLDFKIR